MLASSSWLMGRHDKAKEYIDRTLKVSRQLQRGTDPWHRGGNSQRKQHPNTLIQSGSDSMEGTRAGEGHTQAPTRPMLAQGLANYKLDFVHRVQSADRCFMACATEVLKSWK